MPPPDAHPLLVGAQFQGTWSNYSDPVREKLLDELVAMGIRTVRIGVSWAMIQPDRPTAGDARLELGWGVPRVDSVVAMALARGLIVHATFGRTPAWANDGAGEAAAPTPERLATAVRFVAHRYQGKVSSWEIWNEPNLPKYFTDGTPAAIHEAALRRLPGHPPHGSADPVVFGGVNGNDWEFIKAAYQAARRAASTCSPSTPTSAGASRRRPGARAPSLVLRRTSRLVRQVQAEFHDLKPIWFTEFGWSTHANAPGTARVRAGGHRAAAGRATWSRLCS